MKRLIVLAVLLGSGCGCGDVPVPAVLNGRLTTVTQNEMKHWKWAKPPAHDAGTPQTADAGVTLPAFYTAGAIGGPMQDTFSADGTLEIYFYVEPPGDVHLEIFDPGSNPYVAYGGPGHSWFQMPVAGTYISQYQMTGGWMANAFVNGKLIGTVFFEVNP